MSDRLVLDFLITVAYIRNMLQEQLRRAPNQEVLRLPVASAEEVKESFRRKIEERAADLQEEIQPGYLKTTGIALFDLDGSEVIDVYCYNEFGGFTRKQAPSDLVLNIGGEVMNSYGIQKGKREPEIRRDGDGYSGYRCISSRFPTNTPGLFFVRNIITTEDEMAISRVRWDVEAIKLGKTVVPPAQV